MLTLTIENIRRNPWKIFTRKLPDHPERLLLELAYLAAEYCRASEHSLEWAARDCIYKPAGWLPEPGFPDAHEESETLAFAAHMKLKEICDIYEREFGERLEE